MRRSRRALLLVVTMAATASIIALPVTSRELAAVVASEVVAVDVDRDGVAELYCITPSQHTIRDQRGVIRWRSHDSVPRPAAGVPCLVAEATGDGTPEVIIAAGMADSLGASYVYWFDLKTRQLRCCPVTGPTADAGSRWSVRAMAAADLNGDGVNELLVGLNAGRRNRPDMVSAVDCRSGTRLWSVSLRPDLTHLSADDLDDDGSAEVLVGTLPAGDSVARIVCLDRHGYERWQYRSAGPASERREFVFGVVRTQREGPALLAVLDRGGTPGASPDVLRILNGTDGRVIVQSSPSRRARWVQLAVGDLDGDDLPEILTADSRGGVQTRDLGLRTLRTAVLDDIVDALLTVPGKSGQQPVAVQDCTVTLLDRHLRVIGSIVCPAPVANVVPLHVGRGKPVRLLLADAGAAGVRTFWVRELVLPARPFPWLPVLAGLFLVLLAGAAVAVGTNAFHAAALSRLTRWAVESAGVAVLDRKGRLAPADGRARMLLADYAQDGRLDVSRLLSRPEFEPLRDPLQGVRSGAVRTARCELMLLVDRLPRAFRVTVTASLFGTCLLAFEDLAAVEYVRHIREWGPVAQRMAHGIKNPLTAMSLTLQRMTRTCPPETMEQVASLMEDVDRLRRMADGFMRFVKLEPPRLAREDLNAVIRSCLDKPGSVRPEGIVVEPALSAELPLIPLDRAQFC
ncbi:hypothetical protein FJY69_09335, partial [candidate division WOR-3 bacterium]|nr:hypothetical protein [candidate division WOR-3 bacterium]